MRGMGRLCRLRLLFLRAFTFFSFTGLSGWVGFSAIGDSVSGCSTATVAASPSLVDDITRE
uniref:Uncharacterized protein n=1 Tax=Nelumbo nucifera TaxID=4432 RepID=A0A822ZLH4_NELNU|nr:TPA_asm: hypothetical protein HUJ06_002535 [Nelumbo nucifera]